MQITSLFPTPLIRASLGAQSPLIAALRDAILSREAEMPDGTRHSNDGGWQSGHDLPAWTGVAGESLIEGLTRMLDQATTLVLDDRLDKRRPDWRVNAWANVNRHGHGNLPHCHPSAAWSGCIYVDDGGIGGRPGLGGCIEFSDPRGPLPLMYAPSVKVDAPGFLSAGLGERVWPETGLILLFPSWLLHHVAPYTGEGTRISIAVNFSL
ncbi:TIGR02466 family protein [Niveispirillum sp. KHB5.9]|uniref:TIGR02466 family protein n=1 Tax=Niveispirillum sp. KHB5.9 TaxID=3400269 RepID=UPI003A85F823